MKVNLRKKGVFVLAVLGTLGAGSGVTESEGQALEEGHMLVIGCNADGTYTCAQIACAEPPYNGRWCCSQGK